MRQLLRERGDQLLAAFVITLVLMGVAALVPATVRRLAARPEATPTPAANHTAPPVGILLPDERDRALLGVMTIVNDHTFGTAFLIDAQGDLLTAASLIANSQGLRLVDNTGGMHEVRVLGIDSGSGVAMVRANVINGVPMSSGDASTLQAGDSVVLLASPKVRNLQSATPGAVTAISGSGLTVRVDALAGNLGGPLVGPGGKVLAILTSPGEAVSINQVLPEVVPWIKQPGILLPLAPLPADLQLRGSDTTSSPPASPASTPAQRLTLQSVSPSRASAAQDTVVTIQGGGFADGPALHVRFIPVSGAAGAFDGLGAALVNPSTLTVKVPAGRTVQDYVIQLSNGDGALISSQVGFTVTP